MKDNTSGKPFTVVAAAFVLLLLMSAVDWDALSGGRLSPFNLFGDVMKERGDVQRAVSQYESIDPLLAQAQLDIINDADAPLQTSDTASPQQTPDTDSSLQTPDNYAYTDGDATASTSCANMAASTTTTSAAMTVSATGSHSPSQDATKWAATPPERIDGVLPIEDYSVDGDGLARFRAALAHPSDIARIAVIGDSYIEGDIFTQDVRRLLQDAYGGSGVGYMSMHSDFPGFRRSISQSDSGWEVCDLRNDSKNPLRPLAGEYCIGSQDAVLTLRAGKIAHAGTWTTSRMLFIAPSDGTVTLRADSVTQTFDITASPDVQAVELPAKTSRLTVKSDIPGLVSLGVWVEGDGGVGVDCMSLRGNAGVLQSTVSPSLSEQMRRYVPYHLIVVEYGMNALSAAQSDYSYYAKLMEKTVSHLKTCYPEADFIMMGVGDRGHKDGSAVTSLATVDAMIEAQRKAARNAAVMFWDTRSAMGGKDAIVDWRDKGLVNADYIHLNHKGGAVLAEEFVKALRLKLDGNR